MPSWSIIPNAIRLSPGVVNTELASASVGPGGHRVGELLQRLARQLAGKSVSVGFDALCTDSRMPFSFGTLPTGSFGASLSEPPQAATSRAEGSGDQRERRET